MRRILLSPKWWGVHLLVLAAVLVMLRLGLWQWHRAESASGGIQNYAYAFQWPLFAGFALVLWWKTLRIEAAESSGDDGPGSRPMSRLAARPLPEPAIGHRPGVRVGISTAPIEVDEDDAEVLAYNEHLARLNARAMAGAQGSRRRGG